MEPMNPLHKIGETKLIEQEEIFESLLNEEFRFTFKEEQSLIELMSRKDNASKEMYKIIQTLLRIADSPMSSMKRNVIDDLLDRLRLRDEVLPRNIYQDKSGYYYAVGSVQGKRKLIKKSIHLEVVKEGLRKFNEEKQQL